MILKNGAIVIGFFEKISSQRWVISPLRAFVDEFRVPVISNENGRHE
jgi:hypothetical protein